MKEDIIFLKRAIQIAKQGLYTVVENPLVGAVVVYDSRIIGEGYHKKDGEMHAEVLAINSVEDKSKLTKSTLYVTLEPCCHFGKTPPCVDFILKHKIPKVVISQIDASLKVGGKGVKKLKQNGVEVKILESIESKNLNRIFTTVQTKKRPYIFLKWAQSKDSFLDKDFKRTNISHLSTSIYTQHLRAQAQVIVVGKNTVLNDNPILKTKLPEFSSPIPLVMDRDLSIDYDGRELYDNNEKIFIACDKKIEAQYSPKIELIKCRRNFYLQDMYEYLFQIGITKVLVEGGGQILESHLKEGFFDEAWVFENKKMEIKNGTKAPNIDLSHLPKVEINLSDNIAIYNNY